ncbi:MAG: sigma-E processing peptidase SpoIIGA, partial [Clostridiales bacterium]|nr:sigma-E processing peptidase SpoIIGA [Clostridiales bacterium]
RVAVAVGMVFLAVGRRQQPWRVLALFLLLSCALAGGVLLLERAGLGQMSTGEGVPASLSDGKLLLLCAAGEYLLVSLGGRLPGCRAKQTVPVLLTCEGRRVLLRALVDTGNLLRDPLTGTPVLIAEGQAVARLFPRRCAPTAQELCHPTTCLEQLSRRWTPSRLRLVPYRAVGTERGLLLAVRVDEMEVDGVSRGSRLVAVTPGRLGSDYHGLIGIE